MPTDPVLSFTAVDFVRDGRRILAGVNWTVRRGERWVVLGPNGSGKTTLCRMASLFLYPSQGAVEVLGYRLGRVDSRALRTRIGIASAAVADMIRPTLRVAQVVATGKYAALAPWWHVYDDEDDAQVRAMLGRYDCSHLADAPFGTLSSGERQRVLLARTLMSRPELLLLDEPTAGLDLTGREQLVAALTGLARDATAPATILVTHHVDEIPPGFTHVLLLAAGRVLAAGPLDRALTAEQLSRCFGMELDLHRHNGRWTAWARVTGL